VRIEDEDRILKMRREWRCRGSCVASFCLFKVIEKISLFYFQDSSSSPSSEHWMLLLASRCRVHAATAAAEASEHKFRETAKLKVHQ
jgi:Na+/melibiose symporter-like transporter